MFVFYLVYLVCVLTVSGQTEIPTSGNDPWPVDDTLQYYDSNENLPLDENLFPENSTEVPQILTDEDQALSATMPSLLVGQNPKEVPDSKVWMIVLVTVILLVAVVGSLSTAYYLCVWRGGRIHYQPQKTYT